MPDWLHAFLTFQVVAVLAGSIAYLGNQLGRKIGKRKMTVFKMRPRHTSNFMTAAIGIVIAWTTLGVASLFSEPVRTLITGVSDLRAEEARLRKEIDELTRRIREGQVVWGVGQPILMGTLNPDLGPDGLRQQILAALTAANFESINKNNEIALQDNRKPPFGPQTDLVKYDNKEVAGLVAELANRTEVTGLKVVATQNCFYKNPVPVRLDLLPVTRVFREGEVITARTVEPSDPRFLVLWYDFLDQLKQTAKAKGMIEINNSLGGGMTGQDLERISSAIANLQSPGTVVAVARRDLYQTSPLDVQVEVRP